MSSIKRIADNESGITYTLEAIIGMLLIIGTIIYMTGNMPYTAQKTGEDSKVQLMNIGRDNLDLTLQTPIFEIIGGGIPLAKYILKADNYSVKYGDSVNFTVYDAESGTMINNAFNFNATILYITAPRNITANVAFKTDGSGHQLWFPPSGIPSTDRYDYNNYEYSVQAYDYNSPVGYSNFVTIKVGDYNLTSYTTSIPGAGIVSGVVNYTYTNNSVNNAVIQIGLATNSGPSFNPPLTSTDSNGYFSFPWSDRSSNIYFVQAKNATTGNVSNMHVVETSPLPQLCGSFGAISSCDNITVYEGSNVSLNMSVGDFPNPGGKFFVNFRPDARVNDGNCATSCYITSDGTNANFSGALPGVYAVFICAHDCNNNIWSSGLKTNMILIYVIPISPSLIGETCVNSNELNTYMRRYIPLNVNYNIYLIDPTGHTSNYCEFKPIINGYPTDEAVAVSKLVHIEDAPEGVDNILEYRMVLWYK